MARHVSLVAWSQTMYRISPVSRLTTLKIGGRSLANAHDHAACSPGGAAGLPGQHGGHFFSPAFW
jgi:hypothetical protein